MRLIAVGLTANETSIVKSFKSLSKRGRIGVGTYTASQIVPDDDEDEGEVDLNEEAGDDDEE